MKTLSGPAVRGRAGGWNESYNSGSTFLSR
jgi:hypothetical protein